MTPEQACQMLIDTIEATGGLTDENCPVADPEWYDLGDAYLTACAALNHPPLRQEATCERCGSPLEVRDQYAGPDAVLCREEGWCTDETCPYYTRHQDEEFTEE